MKNLHNTQSKVKEKKKEILNEDLPKTKRVQPLPPKKQKI